MNLYYKACFGTFQSGGVAMDISGVLVRGVPLYMYHEVKKFVYLGNLVGCYISIESEVTT